MTRSLFLFLVVSVRALNLAAQQPTPHLEVTTANNQTTFHIGERIPLTLTFTGSKADNINTAGYDRGGRLGIDYYTVSPATGTSDPLGDYYRTAGAIMAGGLFSIDTLKKPFTIQRDLNEWVRFDQPGDYTITVLSNRVGRNKKTSSDIGNAIPLSSQPLKLHIIPATPEWQQATFARIQQSLAKPRPKRPDFGPSERNDALEDLRYLDTSQAIPALASHVRDDQDDLRSSSWLGLVGVAPAHREIAVAALNKLLDDPDFPVCTTFLSVMSDFQVMQHDASPGTFKDPQVLLDMQMANLENAWNSVLAALPRKQGTALAITAQTLLAYSSPNMNGGDPRITAALSASFLHLPPTKQAETLEEHWDSLNPASRLSTVRTLAMKHERSGGVPDLASISLKRWYELDPDAALRDIETQLNTDKPFYSADDLWFLPTTQTFPQFESLWSNGLGLEHTDDNQLAALLTRFGTGAATSRMQSFLSPKIAFEPCASQAAELAYLVRFAPDTAAPLLHQAISIRTKDATWCRFTLFDDVARHASGSVLIHAAIEALTDPDPRIVLQAAKYLQHYGDDSARQPLLDRYRAWTQAWSGKADQLDQPPPDMPEETQANYDLGPQLGEALLTNQGWLTDKALTEQVLSKAIGKNMRAQLTRLSANSEGNYIELTHFGDFSTYKISNYETYTTELFEAKIAQFPEGTEFHLSRGPMQSPETPAMAEEVRKTLTRHHMKLADDSH